MILLLAGACGVLPDEVAVSGFRSEYDFLGGGNLKELGADEGDSVGIAVTATYKLKPQDVRIVSQTAVPRPQTADRFLDQTADRLAQTADNASYLMLKTLLRPLLLVGGAVVLALLLVFLLFRRRPQ